MINLNRILALLWLSSSLVSADWLEEVKDIQTEIQALTVNQQGLGDAPRLERFFQLSYDLEILENPGFATSTGDPRGQDRLGDLSEEGISRRQHVERDALALMESIDRDALAEENRINYDLLRDRLAENVRGQQFPGHYLQMNQMAGPQQDILGSQSAGRQDRELIAAVPLGHPCRFVTQFISQLYAVHDIRGIETTGERKPDPFHEITSYGGHSLAANMGHVTSRQTACLPSSLYIQEWSYHHGL